MSGPLDGTVVLVAGASSGMGRATAIAAARAGARVALLARRAEVLADVAAEIDGQALAIPGDATDPKQAESAVRQAAEHFGRIDALVNSVGANIRERALTQLTWESWQGLLRTNLDAAFALTQAVLPVFRDQHDGLLLHISSGAAKHPDGSGVGYQASKAGVLALAHATMVEEKANGVRVSVLMPGFTETPLVNQRPTPPTPEDLARALQPEDVAAMCLAVLSLPRRAYVPELVLYPSQM